MRVHCCIRDRGPEHDGATQDPRPKPDERHEVTVRLVLVDVIAVDRDGRFVTDLTEADFEVTEDGKKMDLASAELIELKRAGESPGAVPQAAAPPAAALSRAPRASVVDPLLPVLLRSPK